MYREEFENNKWNKIFQGGFDGWVDVSTSNVSSPEFPKIKKIGYSRTNLCDHKVIRLTQKKIKLLKRREWNLPVVM